jgi:hypothetical protein
MNHHFEITTFAGVSFHEIMYRLGEGDEQAEHNIALALRSVDVIVLS